MKSLLFTVFSLLFQLFIFAQDTANYTSNELIYGRKDGMALTMMKLSPKEKPNHRAIVSVVSGSWVSNFNSIPNFIRRSTIYINAGYTMFLVFHSSQPKYALNDAVADISRSIKFIRYNAKEYEIDGDHIGITGSSSGGHLALMAALADDKVIPESRDKVEQVSSRVQAAAVFFPPVDFVNWGNVSPELYREILRRTRTISAFDFKRFNDSTGLYESMKDESLIRKMATDYSPIFAVSKDDPPVMIAHGDADIVVPLQQSQSMIKKLIEAGIPNELIIKPKGGHGWKNQEEQDIRFLAWFDKYLK